MSPEIRQKIPVPRRSFLWSLNETSGEILTHVGPTEFTPSANDRIVRANDRGGFEAAAMEARPFAVARDGEYVLLSNPIRGESNDESPNGTYIPGGNKERELQLGTTKIVAGPCAFPLWPGQSAEVRPAHKLGANHYLLVEVVGPLDDKARYYRLVIESAGLSSAVIDAGDISTASSDLRASAQVDELRLGQRIVIQGRHTQLFIPPTGIEMVPPLEETDATPTSDEDGVAHLPPKAAEELGKLITQVREGLSLKQFSILKNELRHRNDLNIGERAVMLAALDAANDERSATRRPRERHERRQLPQDPYARRAVVLGPKEFCILFDADGNPRIVRGPARVFPGPHDAFLHRGSRRRVYDAYELSEHQALWLRIIKPVSRAHLAEFLPPGYPLERESYEAGHELIVRGLPSVFFPFIEAEVIHPDTREPHVGNDHDAVVLQAIGIDQQSGIYVRDLRTGMVKMVRGEQSYLVDPRLEEQVKRRVSREQWSLWVAPVKDDVDTLWAVAIDIPTNAACEITSRRGSRVEIGPRTVLLAYDEQLTSLHLSKGPSKDGHDRHTTCFMRVNGARCADAFEVESRDFVRVKVRLGFAGHFEGDPLRWFAVEDPVKLLADAARAKVRAAARELPASELLARLGEIARTALAELRFTENGMVLDQVDLLASQLVDPALADLFTRAQREAFELQLKDDQANRRLESSRRQSAVDDEEHRIVRDAVVRKADSRLVDAEADDRVARRVIELKSAVDAFALSRKQEHDRAILDFEVASEQALTDSHAHKCLREAEAESKAAASRYEVEEAHRRALAGVERELAQGFAAADATRLAAIQSELVAALYAAADSEVMKAAATNMNLVSLLGGKSPAELLSSVVKGTPLERTVDAMRSRAEKSHDGESGAE